MAAVALRGVRKSFGSTAVVHGVDLSIPDGEFCVLVGPSGCGKSTLLRMIAGLDEITGGQIDIGGRVVNAIAPKERDIAMVFQNYALYPHMTVRDNMAFSLKLANVPKAQMDQRVAEAAGILGLHAYLDRYPRQLSGGQRQRVAMGRAIVRKPQVFLFDEPLSNLDAKLRVQMRTEIKELHQRLKTTSIYVTHDQIEAMTMADKIVVMNAGRVEQIGTPLECYDNPANLFVAGFIGSPAMNFFPATLRKDGADLIVDGDTFKVKVPSHRTAPYMGHVDKPIIFGIRPENIHNPEFAPPDISTQPVECIIDVTELMGNEIFVYMKTGENSFVARVDPRTRYHVNDKVTVVFNMNNMHIFDRETEKAIR
jgi:multiple sugar transport system ATP-binding protein